LRLLTVEEVLGSQHCSFFQRRRLAQPHLGRSEVELLEIVLDRIAHLSCEVARVGIRPKEALRLKRLLEVT